MTTQEVNFIAGGYLQLMKLPLMALMKARKLWKLTHSKPDPGLVDSTPYYLNVVKTCLTKQSHHHFPVHFQPVFLYLIDSSLKILNGALMATNASSLLHTTLRGSQTLFDPMLPVHQPRVFVETASFGLTQTSQTTCQALSHSTQSQGPTVPLSKGRNQGRRRGFRLLK